jgi:hypothetical protein
MVSDLPYGNATEFLSSVSSIKKDLGASLESEAQNMLKLKCPPPIGYNFKLI